MVRSTAAIPTARWVKGLSALLLAVILLCAPAPLISCSSPQTSMSGGELSSDIDAIFVQVALPAYKVLAKVDGAEWTGSAVAISRKHLVTAAHVVTDKAKQPVAGGLTVYSKLARYIADAKVVKLLVKYDLAVLEVNVTLPNRAFLASDTSIPRLPQWGARVWVSGYPLGVDEPVVTDGRINSLDDSKWIRYTAPQIYGNSGGPVFSYDAVYGRFVLTSIAQANYGVGMSMVTHMSLGVNSFTLNKFIEEYR